MPRQGSNPYWRVKDGFFEGFNFQGNAVSDFWRVRCQKLNLPASVSVYHRGSTLEEATPFHASDLDLVLIGPNHLRGEVLKRFSDVSSPNGRFLELHYMTPEGISECRTLGLLMHTRSLHLHGPKLEFAPVSADFETMRAHMHRYGAASIPDKLTGPRMRRVCELKNMTRSFGIFEFLSTGRFTRDIASCIEAARKLNSEAADQLERYWLILESGVDLPPMDVTLIHSALSTLRRTGRQIGKNKSIPLTSSAMRN